jgi:hypothetical protein
LKDVINFVLENSKELAYISSSLGILFVGLELGLKFRAERRLRKSSQVESHIKLLKIFTELMDIAEARKETTFSKDLLDYLIKTEKIDAFLDKKKGAKDPFLVYPVGKASQLTAISSIYELAKKHKILLEPSTQALKNLKNFPDNDIKNLTKDYLTKLK